MQITSTAFTDGGEIPRRYSRDGDDVSPPLSWTDVPSGARSLALIVDDPDAPDPAAPKRTFVHWVIADLPPDSLGIAEGADRVPGAHIGLNDWNNPGWNGPAPPVGKHRYMFKLYALDRPIGVAQPTKADVERAMQGHVLAEAKLTGTFESLPAA
jgi:Raf kinase inhibitor-like YbhB/YbcL family protein